MGKIRTWLAVPALTAAMVVPTMAATWQVANAAPKGTVVPADYTCPAASATAPACLYSKNYFNGDYKLYAPNTGTWSTEALYGVRNRNTRWFLCVNDLDAGTLHYFPPDDKGDVSNLGTHGHFVQIWFHGNSTCYS